MKFNPLRTPWGAKKKPPEPEKAPVPNFIGVRNETQRDDARAACTIVVEVRGIKGVPNGQYKLAYEPGVKLGAYLARLKLKRAAIYSAVRDRSNPEAGKLRMTYVPSQNAHIVLGNASVSSALQYQRTNVDAQRVAANMGKAGGRGPPPQVVEVPLRRK